MKAEKLFRLLNIHRQVGPVGELGQMEVLVAADFHGLNHARSAEVKIRDGNGRLFESIDMAHQNGAVQPITRVLVISG